MYCHMCTAGVRLQDEAAEDPLTAAQSALPPNLELYWRNKLQAPLTEILDKVLNPSQLQALMTGPHTLVRSEQVAASSVAGTPEAVAAAAAAAGAGGNVVGGSTGVNGPGSNKGAAGKGGGARQVGLTVFFKHKPLCLSCRQPVPAPQHGNTSSGAPSGSGSGGEERDGDDVAVNLAPGLCDACRAVPGRWAELVCASESDMGAQQQQLTAAVSQCMRCHSGGMAGPVLCTNAECNVLFERLAAARRLAASGLKLKRLVISEPSDAAHVYQW